MSTRTLVECDRCHREIRGPVAAVISFEGKDQDFCSGCRTKLVNFLSGAELEVPP